VLRNSAIPRAGARHERILKAVLIVVALMASLSNMYFIRQLFQLITDIRRGHILAIDRWWYSRRTWSDRGRGIFLPGFGELFRRYRRMPRPTARIAHDAKLEFPSKDRRKLRGGVTFEIRSLRSYVGYYKLTGMLIFFARRSPPTHHHRNYRLARPS
jgi:hypothetical protein